MKYLVVLLTFFFSMNSIGNVTMPFIFSDNMVLQRDREIRIWGKADPDEKIKITFSGRVSETVANVNGRWSLALPAMTAGGPFVLTVTGNNELSFSNVMIGDVYLCSGQSNMEWPVSKSDSVDLELARDIPSNLRLIVIPKKIAEKPQDDIMQSSWEVATPASVHGFSALAYYFGKNIHARENVPVGLIGSYWGGTIIQSWMSREALVNFYDTLTMNNVNTIEDLERWKSRFYQENDNGKEEKWFQTDYPDKSWKQMEVPAVIENNKELEHYDGVIWFRKTVAIHTLNKKYQQWIHLGFISQVDEVYVNGRLIGSSFSPKIWRTYKIPTDIISENDSITIAIRVFNPYEEGGLVELYPKNMVICADPWTIIEPYVPVHGAWKYKSSFVVKETVTEKIPNVITSPNDFKASLYNGMIAPVTSYAIKGALWYQGESNAKDSAEAALYARLFPAMITDWRKRWGWEFPFMYVQLANYLNKKKPCMEPCKSYWAILRESQFKTLSLPATGMVTAMDLGNPHDIHPTNKQAVAHRMSMVAEHLVYNREVNAYGPIATSIKKEKASLRIQFKNIEGGWDIRNRYGYIQGFSIAGSDGVFYWAKATIEGNDILVSSTNVTNPVEVRYAWEDNPEDANLYNREGLPAFPFRLRVE